MMKDYFYNADIIIRAKSLEEADTMAKELLTITERKHLIKTKNLKLRKIKEE